MPVSSYYSFSVITLYISLITSFGRGFLYSSSRALPPSSSSSRSVYDISKEVAGLDELYGTDFFAKNSQFSFGLLEDKDISEAVMLSITSFFKPRLSLNTDGMKGIESSLARGAVQTFTMFEKFDAELSEFYNHRIPFYLHRY